mmetsp:Transcript_2164/g.5643  ORF Transcript_2164/g.5643 Transcript_2164/m.5643 type:complete len:269 (-) Transcript_2164:366-1172(-)
MPLPSVHQGRLPLRQLREQGLGCRQLQGPTPCRVPERRPAQWHQPHYQRAGQPHGILLGPESWPLAGGAGEQPAADQSDPGARQVHAAVLLQHAPHGCPRPARRLQVEHLWPSVRGHARLRRPVAVLGLEEDPRAPRPPERGRQPRQHRQARRAWPEHRRPSRARRQGDHPDREVWRRQGRHCLAQGEARARRRGPQLAEGEVREHGRERQGLELRAAAPQGPGHEAQGVEVRAEVLPRRPRGRDPHPAPAQRLPGLVREGLCSGVLR